MLITSWSTTPERRARTMNTEQIAGIATATVALTARPICVYAAMPDTNPSMRQAFDRARALTTDRPAVQLTLQRDRMLVGMPGGAFSTTSPDSVRGGGRTHVKDAGATIGARLGSPTWSPPV